jgi:hypothetical protein
MKNGNPPINNKIIVDKSQKTRIKNIGQILISTESAAKTRIFSAPTILRQHNIKTLPKKGSD